MVVSVKFHGLQRHVTHTKQIEVPLSEKKRVTDVLSYIKERYPDLPVNENTFLVTVNNHVTKLDQILKANDKISFIPHIGGG